MSTEEAKPGAKEKLKIGMYWAAGCGGCDISLLEIGPRLLELIEAADIVFWPCAAACPSNAIQQAGFNDAQVTAELKALLQTKG